MDVLVATDFFTAEVWTLVGLVTYSILFFIHLGSRQVHIAGVTPHPNAQWMTHVVRNVTMEAWGFLRRGAADPGNRQHDSASTPGPDRSGALESPGRPPDRGG